MVCDVVITRSARGVGVKRSSGPKVAGPFPDSMLEIQFNFKFSIFFSGFFTQCEVSVKSHDLILYVISGKFRQIFLSVIPG